MGSRRNLPRRRQKSIAVLLGGALAVLIAHWLGFGPTPKPSKTTPTSEQPAPTSRVTSKQSGSFDFYLLALSLTPAFCELEPNKRQCVRLNRQTNAQTPLTLHGLWPDKSAARIANCGGEGFSLKSLREQIDPERISRLMPGAADGLAAYQWRKHGSCSGLTPEVYFGEALDWTERINAVLASALAASTGKTLSADGLRSTAEKLMPGLGGAMSFHCKARPRKSSPLGSPMLVELRICLSKAADNRIDSLAECAAVDRIDQGCGQRFAIDEV